MPYSNKQSFLGQGWSFPAEFDEQTLSVAMVTDEEDIRQSLFILFATTPGERIMTPHYGCDLNSLVFEKIGDSLRAAIVAMVTKAMVLFEPRVKVEKVDVEIISHETGLLHILVDYTIIQTNSRSNMVYPYYLLEGTKIVS